MIDKLYYECIGRFPPNRPKTVRCKECGAKLGEADFAYSNRATCRRCVTIVKANGLKNEVAA